MSRLGTSYTVVLSDPAEDDLIGISAWYLERHPAGEQRFFDDFSAMRDMLAQHPRIGRERPDLRSGLRSWPVHPYVVLYEVGDTARLVIIERVVHGHIEIDEDGFE